MKLNAGLMKKQKLEQQNNYKTELKSFIGKNILIKSIVVIIFTAMLFACKNDIKTVSALSNDDSSAVLVAHDIEFIFSDSAFVKAKLTSPLMEKYESDAPYTLFPKGFKIVFYKGYNKIESELVAEYGINYEKQKLLVAKQNVVVKNISKNEQLETEELTWDQRKKIIFSEQKVKITTPSEILFGDGLHSDEKFDRYEIKNLTGKIEVEDDEEK